MVMATRQLYSDEQVRDLALQSIRDAKLTRTQAAYQLDVSRAAISQALNPNNPSYYSMRSLRIRIAEELGNYDIEYGFLVHKDDLSNGTGPDGNVQDGYLVRKDDVQRGYLVRKAAA